QDQTQRLQFLEMFTCKRWTKLTTEWSGLDGGNKGTVLRQRVLGVRSQIPEGSRRKSAALAENTTGPPETVLVNDKDMAEWFEHHRELVCELFHLGYSEVVVAEMYKQGLRHREMLKLTWFQGESATASQDINLKYQGQHGFVFGDPVHIAERHLYKH